MTKPTPPPGDQQGFPPMVWRIVSEFGVLWKWTSCKDEADRQENYGRMAVPYVPESLLSEAVRESEKLKGILKDAESALDDYINRLEMPGGSTLYFGHGILTRIRAAIYKAASTEEKK